MSFILALNNSLIFTKINFLLVCICEQLGMDYFSQQAVKSNVLHKMKLDSNHGQGW